MADSIKPIVLVILDGFGYCPATTFNAIYHAKKPHFNAWMKQYPHTILQAAGPAVGLLPGQMGNSEVGHLAIGSGRIIPQAATRIITAIDDGSFFTNGVLKTVLENVIYNRSRLHLMGLVSDGRVHSHEKILYSLLEAAQQHTISEVFVHAFLDGRDVPPESASRYLQQLDTQMKQLNTGKLGSIGGRFYAMDRDNNWERTEKSYNVLTEKKQLEFRTWHEAVTHYYNKGITDEFIPPTQLSHESVIGAGDTVIFFNFRPDRARQLTEAFIAPQFDHFPRKKIALAQFVTMTDYNHNKFNTTVLFKPFTIKNTLPEVLQKNGKTMFAVAETEKYAHVTYFFNGGTEEKLPNETRVLVPSVALKNYIEFPQMSADGITDAVLHSLKTAPKDFYLINYANADMVGHSGNFEATVKAIEFLDHELGRLYKAVVEEHDGTLFITADHGNAEDMYDEKTNQPKTSHTANPVYFLMIKKELKDIELKKLTGLSDIAPFILKQMNVPVPGEMKQK